jgi:hypothetical protein
MTFKELVCWPYDYIKDAIIGKAWALGYAEGWSQSSSRAEFILLDQSKMILELSKQLGELQEQSRLKWTIDKERVFHQIRDKVNPAVLFPYLGDRMLTTTEIKALQAELKAMKQFTVYPILIETLKQSAVEKAVINSGVTSVKDENLELLAGKMMLHNLGLEASIIKAIEDYKV